MTGGAQHAGADWRHGLTANGVVCTALDDAERATVKVHLTPEIEADGVPGVDYIDQPTFAVLPDVVEDCVIDVEIRSRLRSNAPDYSRAFAGIAYRISEDLRSFEAVYLRPLNGTKTGVDEPRRSRAVQYFAYPEWPFDRLREEYPDGRFESSADIGPDEWIRLHLEIRGSSVRARIGDTDGFEVARTLAEPRAGRIGLFVDIGADADFADLRVRAL